MDRNSIKHLLILSLLIVQYVQLTKASSAGCRVDPNICELDEVCHRGYFFGKCVKRSEVEGYYYYGRGPEWQRNVIRRPWNDFDTRRQDIPREEESYRERQYDNSEPTLEDKTLIRSLPLDEKKQEIRNAHPVKEENIPPVLPFHQGPELVGTRDGISVNSNKDSNTPVEDSRGYKSNNGEYQDAPHQTFHEANEQISIEHIPGRQTDSNDTPQKESALQSENTRDENVQSSSSSESNDLASKGKIMIKGEVLKTESNIDQGPNPEKTYDRIKDFFKSQQASSIVDVPNAVKREEAAKSNKNNFVPDDKTIRDEVNAEEVVDPKDSSESSLKIDLNKRVDKSSVRMKTVNNDYSPEDESDIAKRINQDATVKETVERQMGVKILKANEDTPKNYKTKEPHAVNPQPRYFILTLAVVGCVTGVILAAVAVYLIMKRYNETKKFKPVTLPGQEAAAEYQELCRQFRASQGWEGSTVKPSDKEKAPSGNAKPPPYSWSEEPVVPNMDISTGHVVLAYMEDHLKNKDRLNKEWEALCSYEAEPNIAETGKQDKNVRKNRYSDVLPYDHNRVTLRETANATGSDYINASFITDHDPRNPAYIATQGPLAHTVSDFWQMIWEQGVVVLVNLTRLSDLGLPQCHRYWPEEGHETYHIYEVHLVSEHIWCDDYLVRSFYLKNLQTSETRTVTQFHFLSWPDLNVPTNPKPLLEFRRKVNKCFRGRSCPIVVHCSGGVGRTGCYILIDMVLNKMMRGAKEIDIAATVEHLRDQRPHMVKTKAQFEFALTAVAEEVSAILQALAK